MSVKQHFFYQLDQLACILGAAGKQRMFRGAGGVCHGVREMLGGTSSLMQLDSAQSVIAQLDADRHNPVRYSVYGFDPGERAEGLPGFNGQPCHVRVKGYLLGNGKRLYSTALGRFLSPDPYSPFEKGGINAYVYCGGDPVNRIDVTGHAWNHVLFKHLNDKLQPIAQVMRDKGNSHRLKGLLYDADNEITFNFRARAKDDENAFELKRTGTGKPPSNFQEVYFNESNGVFLHSTLESTGSPNAPAVENILLSEYDTELGAAGYKKMIWNKFIVPQPMLNILFQETVPQRVNLSSSVVGIRNA